MGFFNFGPALGLDSPLVTVFVVVVVHVELVIFGRHRGQRQVRTVAQLPEDVRGHVVVRRRVGQLVFGALAQDVFGLGRKTVHGFRSSCEQTILLILLFAFINLTLLRM